MALFLASAVRRVSGHPEKAIPRKRLPRVDRKAGFR